MIFKEREPEAIFEVDLEILPSSEQIVSFHPFIPSG